MKQNSKRFVNLKIPDDKTVIHKVFTGKILKR
jgi:hypothetical protein